MKKITYAISGAALGLMSTSALAGALDRDILTPNTLFMPGTVNQLHYTTTTPNIEGSFYDGAYSTGDAGTTTETFGWTYKVDYSSKFSYALIIERPYAIGVDYADADEGTGIAGANAHLSAFRGTLMGRYKVNENFSVLGGIIGEQIKPTDVIYPASLGNYKLRTNSDKAFGFTVGAAYEIPEKGQRFSVLYTSPVSHELNFYEFDNEREAVAFSTPQSLTLSAQTALSERINLAGSLRWADWSEFDATPPVYEEMFGQPLFAYDSDVITYDVSMSYKVTDDFAVFGGVTYEAPSDDEAYSIIRPYDGRTALNLGGQYSFDTAIGTTRVGAGVSYATLGGVDGEIAPGWDFSYEDTTAVTFGVNLTFMY